MCIYETNRVLAQKAANLLYLLYLITFVLSQVDTILFKIITVICYKLLFLLTCLILAHDLQYIK